MSTTYGLALRGLKTDEEYIKTIHQFLNSHAETKLEKDSGGYSLLNHLITMYLDYETMGLDVTKEIFDFDADIEFQVYFFGARYEEGVDLLLQLAAYLETLGVEYLFEDDVEVFRKENGVLTISPERKEYEYYLNEETIRRFLK